MLKTDLPTGSLWIIIVNYRTADLVVDCLRSIAAQLSELAKCQTLVIDNCSGDRSLERLGGAIEQEGWQRWARVIASDRNGGFAYGNNIGIRQALQATDRVDFVMLLNPDTIVRPGAIRALLNHLSLHDQVGIVGSQLENAEGGSECSAHNAPSPIGEMLAGASLGVLTRALNRYAVSPPVLETPHECDWVSGASLMARREVFERIGLLDEQFFLYFEEVDFCVRAGAAGWKIWLVPESRVVHFEGASTGIRVVRRRPRYWYESRRRYFVKHFGVPGLLLADVLWSLGKITLLLRRVLGLVSSEKEPDPRWYAFDLWSGDLRSVFDTGTWKIR